MGLRFAFATTLRVRPPYRLDLTVDALRRTVSNVVDVVDDAGVYRRAMADASARNVVEVRQTGESTLAVRIAGRNGERRLTTIERMLGTQIGLQQWERRAASFAWLRTLMQRFRGVRPPRYLSAWEALAHAIVFQQISIAAASSIMRRTIEAIGEPLDADGVRYYPFPTPEQLLAAPESTLRAAGLSGSKIMHLRSAARALADGHVDADVIEGLPTAAAAERLCSIRGIGPWSAAVVLLRGFGRLDTFPLNDSGVARSIRLLSGDPEIEVEKIVKRLGPVRGMLYFHLLLGRMRHRLDASGVT